MEFSVLVALGLVLVRVGTLVLASPAFGGLFAPAMLKIGLSLVLAFALLPVVPLPASLGVTALAAVVAREVAIGLSLALVVRVLTAAAELGGHLAGFQLGFGYAATVDPASGARNNVLATMYGTLTLLLFLGLNGHHLLLRTLVGSYQRLPVGLGGLDGSIVTAVIGMLGVVFVLGTQLAAPVVIVMLLVELSLGLMERAAVGADVQVLAPPVRVLVGMTALAAGLSAVPEAVSRVVTRVFELAFQLALGLR
jgi:flagellar biosynthetic protein FliR